MLRRHSAPIRGLILLWLALVGCGNPKADQNVAEPGQRDDGEITCAKAGDGVAKRCVVEQSEGPSGTVLTVRHDDGAFRRLLVTKHGGKQP